VRYSTQIKPISYVKAHAADLLDRITKEREPIIITQNGEARAVLVDIRSYEENQERLEMLQVMSGSEEVHVGEPLSRMEVYSEFAGRKPVQSEKAPLRPEKLKLNQL
jgi:prevent-host-death family protein